MTKIAHNKGKTIKITKECPVCKNNYLTYLSREKKYCSANCYVKSGAMKIKNDLYFSDPENKIKFIEAVKKKK